MEIDPATLDQRDLYKLITGCVVPRPIAWVASQDSDGNRNLAPFSFFNALGSNPPALMLSVNYSLKRTGRKDTLHNILDLGEFVVNIVTEETAAAMNSTSAELPAGMDEFAVAGLTPVPSLTVRPPRVAESPVSFECTLHTTLPLGEGPGSSTVVIGLIQHIAVRDELLNERMHVDVRRLRPVGRLVGNQYCYVREIFELIRP